MVKSEWGNLLQRMCTIDSPKEDLEKINSRVISPKNNIKEEDIPNNAVYATSNNNDKAAINDGIFAKFVASTHSMNPDVDIPLHTICIKASNMSFKENAGKQYKKENGCMSDIVYSSCSDGHVKNKDGTRYDPMLKLYEGRPLCISENIDVKNCVANGAVAKFKGIIFKDNLSVDPLEKILIDGYYVYCTNASMVKALVVEMIDGNKKEHNPKIIKKLEH